MVSKRRTFWKLLPALGLALVAVLALSAVGAASASAAAPENTVSPAVSPTAPETGTVETTTKGTWTGSPTSYAYVWFRCNASGVECKSIPGATSSTYTPVTADVGKTLLASVTASNAEGSGVALSKPTSAVTNPPKQYWYTCGTKKGSLFSCAPNGEVAWVKLAEETPTKVTLKGTSPFKLKFSLSGAKVEIVCTTLTGEGSIMNPWWKGTGSGTASNTSFNFTGCTVATPLKCTVKNFGFLVSGEAIVFGGKPAVKFGSGPESALASIGFEGAECGLKGETFQLFGTFIGISNSTIVGTNALFEFTAASSGLNVGPNAATLEGTSEIQTTTEKLVKIAP
jgi:hypothetical protein